MTLGVLLSVLQVGLSPVRESVRVPNDPQFIHQLSFYAKGGVAFLPRSSTREGGDTVTIARGVTLDAPRAWTLTTGSRAVVVAVLDDGFFYSHEDLAGNLWRNPGESGVDQNGYSRETNGLDDDGNGFVDDVHGWDFVFGDPDPDAYVYDGMDRSRIQPYWHSISALGIIGARGDNGIGVTGINWDISLMLLKIGAQGIRRSEVDTARVTRAARAIRYAVDNGARIINWSGFVDVRDPVLLAPLRDAVQYAARHDVLLVTGAGNNGDDLDQDEHCLYPQCFDFPNQIRVAQVGFDGALYRYETGGQARGSNYGVRRVEIAALGEHFTTDVQNGVSTYRSSNGTSSAGPVVAGVAALVLAVRPDLSAVQLKRVLLESAVRLPGLESRVTSGGVVNAYRAVRLALDRSGEARFRGSRP
jgi:subtilisin family serine protease